jgi:hypothetical protein
MTKNLWASIFAVLITLPMSMASEAAYQYTYTTTAPFDHFYNYHTKEYYENEAADFTADNSFKLVITSDNLLTVSRDYTTEQYLADATFDFYVGNYSLRAAEQPYPTQIGDSAVFSTISLTAVDGNGLPTEWQFSAEYFTQLGFGFYTSTKFETRNPIDNPEGFGDAYAAYFHIHNYFGNRADGELVAIADSGVWTLNEISSPVPEVPEYAMFLAGLSLIGFLGRRKSKNDTYLSN